MNASMFKGYLRYIANRRATQIGLETLFPNEENPSMDERDDRPEEGTQLLRTRVIEYQSSSAAVPGLIPSRFLAMDAYTTPSHPKCFAGLCGGRSHGSW